MNLGPAHRVLLRILSDHRWHKGSELAEAAGRRFAARLWELRKDPSFGLQPIEKRRDPQGTFDFEWRLSERKQVDFLDPLWRLCNG